MIDLLLIAIALLVALVLGYIFIGRPALEIYERERADRKLRETDAATYRSPHERARLGLPARSDLLRTNWRTQPGAGLEAAAAGERAAGRDGGGAS